MDRGFNGFLMGFLGVPLINGGSDRGFEGFIGWRGFGGCMGFLRGFLKGIKQPGVIGQEIWNFGHKSIINPGQSAGFLGFYGVIWGV